MSVTCWSCIVTAFDRVTTLLPHGCPRALHGQAAYGNKVSKRLRLVLAVSERGGKSGNPAPHKLNTLRRRDRYPISGPRTAHCKGESYDYTAIRCADRRSHRAKARAACVHRWTDLAAIPIRAYAAPPSILGNARGSVGGSAQEFRRTRYAEKSCAENFRYRASALRYLPCGAAQNKTAAQAARKNDARTPDPKDASPSSELASALSPPTRPSQPLGLGRDTPDRPASKALRTLPSFDAVGGSNPTPRFRHRRASSSALRSSGESHPLTSG